MSSQKKKSNAVPPPPRPDPITLDHIYDRLTAPDVMMEERAYHLVALSTVAFHPSVKLFLFEHTPLHAASVAAAAAEEVNKKRREAVLKSIAFFLAQRSSAVVQECRWETVALLGELCRLETIAPLRPGGNVNNNNNNNNNNININSVTSVNGTTVVSPQQEVMQKINSYARANLEFLAQLPWFVPALRELIGEEEEEKEKKRNEATSSSLSSSSSPPGGRRRRSDESDGGNNGMREGDEDVRIAIKDILAALPEVRRDGGGESNNVAVVWSEECVNQAHDLMFLDASTTMLHLIPLVSRSSHVRCAHCGKHSHVHTDGGNNSNTNNNNSNNNNNNNNNPLLRCGSCRAVYYCDAACQRAHWSAAHRVPCKSYKQRSDDIMAEYEAMNKRKGGGRKKTQQKQQEAVSVLEVPLEPSLFYETRRYLYDHRDASFAGVSFMDYFMKYTVRGN